LLSFAAFAIASGGLGRLRFVVDLEVLDLAAAELAALLLHVELEAALDHVAQAGVGAGVGQHEADLDGRIALRLREACEAECAGDRRQLQKGLHEVSSSNFNANLLYL
jgi:hypothetical protein